LGYEERKNLVERLVKIAEEDNEAFLLKLRDRIDRSLCRSRALPTFVTFFVNVLDGFLNHLHVLPSRKKHLSILQDVSGIIRPCRMTLLLGPPSSGKTTLLLALAGKLASDLKFSGRVTYNGCEMHEFVPQRTAAYISQKDVHTGEMTVRETLAFSARCQGVGSRYEMLAELSRREKEANIKPDPDIDIFMKARKDIEFQSLSCSRNRSSTTFQIVKLLRQYVYILQGTALISLLQPAPETYDLFDDVILISTVRLFIRVPGKCDSRKDQEQYWTRRDEPYRFITVTEFAEAFRSFHAGKSLGDELAVPFDKAKSHPAALTTRKYGVSKKELLKACASRELLLMKRNSFVYIFKLMQLSVMALITMTLFFRTEMHRNSETDGQTYAGALFFTTVMVMFNGLSEISMTVLKLPVFYKQRDLLFYPSWAYSIPMWILRVTVSCIEVALWVILTYYVVGYEPSMERGYEEMVDMGLLASPLMYAQNAILVNEFLGHSWGHVISNSKASLGEAILKSRGYFPYAYWYWLGVGALLGFVFLYNFCFTLALTYLNREYR
ncbi:unnamed protein product, partial [Thlaspi arvense]